MSEFVNRAEYEKWKTSILERLSSEEERRYKWVCPMCLSSLPLSRSNCGCGYEAGRSILRFLRGDVTSSDLYGAVRKEFHDGDHARALFLSSYLVRRFPDAEEAKHLREYGTAAENVSSGDTPQKGRRGSAVRTAEGLPSAGKMVGRAAIAVAFAVVLALVLADVFSPRSAIPPPAGKADRMNNVSSAPPPPHVVAGRDGTPDGAKEDAEGDEFREPLSAMGQRGFGKGLRVAKVFLSNKPLVIWEKCDEAMQREGTQDSDYISGCMKGYDSYRLAHEGETGEKDESSPPGD